MSKELPLNLADWDEHCMQEFIEENSSSFYLFASRYVDDKEVIDDFLQEAYIKLWTHRKTIGTVKSPRNYFFTIIRNVILDKWAYLQQSNHEKNMEESLNISSNETFIENIIEAESSLLIAKAIEKLSPQSQQVILMTMKGNNMNEIAETLHVTINTVKTVKYRALKQLSELLSKEDFLLFLFFIHF